MLVSGRLLKVLWKTKQKNPAATVSRLTRRNSAAPPHWCSSVMSLNCNQQWYSIQRAVIESRNELLGLTWVPYAEPLTTDSPATRAQSLLIFLIPRHRPTHDCRHGHYYPAAVEEACVWLNGIYWTSTNCSRSRRN